MKKLFLDIIVPEESKREVVQMALNRKVCLEDVFGRRSVTTERLCRYYDLCPDTILTVQELILDEKYSSRLSEQDYESLWQYPTDKVGLDFRMSPEEWDNILYRLTH